MFWDEYLKQCNKKGKPPTVCAVEMGFQKSNVTRWKNGMVPRRNNLWKMAEYFGCDITDLIDEEKETDPEEESGLSEIQKLLISEIPHMDDDAVSTLLILAKQLTRRKQSLDSHE